MLTGREMSRVDGPLKVTGAARYACEHWDLGQPLYGFILGARIGGPGRIARLDTTRAEQAPGVRLVLTYRNAPAQGATDVSIVNPYERARPVLDGPAVRAYGEPVALAVATTFEQARDAAGLVDVAYVSENGHYDFASRWRHARRPMSINGGFAIDTAIGNVDAGLAAAAVALDQIYTTPYQMAQPMEPHACLAAWQGDDLILYLGAQTLSWIRPSIARTLGIAESQVHIRSPYVGGAFGSKLGIHAETVLAALAARQLRHPVKVAMTRPQMFQLVGHRPASRQRVRLGADRDGRLVAIAHDVVINTSPHEEYTEQAATTTRSLYAAPNRSTTYRVAALDLSPGEDVRGPGEGPGLLAIESAMDELAHQLNIDPIELRVRNEPARDPETDAPFFDRRLVDCMREGARRFGWERRPTKPAGARDGRWLVGYGMAAAIRFQYQGAAKASVRLRPDGIAVVESDMTDIGTGHYTILTQVAADALGLPVDCVRVELGRSEFPASGGSGASWGAAITSLAVQRACDALRARLLAAVQGDPGSALCGKDLSGATIADGVIKIAGESESLIDTLRRLAPEGMQADGELSPSESASHGKGRSIHTYGAQFAEVGVNIDTAEVRVRRMLGVFAVGRILNPKTARSQLIGGMAWGMSAALHEEALVDARSGAFVNHDLAEYVVPVHADVPSIDAIMLDGDDVGRELLGIRGTGELGICGSGAAIANAVFNATGIRVRDFPITLDKLLLRLHG